VNKFVRMIWAGNVARVGERKGACRVLVLKLEGKGPLGRPRCRWEDNIKIYVQEAGWSAWTGFFWFRTGIGAGLL
jgi:hypothetical protein